MKRSELPIYNGLERASIRHKDAPSVVEPYVPEPDLIEAVQVAIYLKRPLLLEGEPGCGKTRLAYSIADQLGIPLEIWSVNSGSKASDGLYKYDALLRLHDVQISSQLPEAVSSTGRDPAFPMKYVVPGALGRAFLRRDTTSVVLIDEIDKADFDFANDLLTVIDKNSLRFSIGEAGDQVVEAQPDCEPIVIVTSNRDKGSLPDPFLRRCIYHYVRFPDPMLLERIVEVHYRARNISVPVRLREAIGRFMPLRQGMVKPPGTSELLDWLTVLDTLQPPRGSGFSRLDDQDVPYPQVLLKTADDLHRVTDPTYI